MKAMLLLHQAAHRRVPWDVSPPALRRCPQGHSDWDSISVLLRALERAGQPLSTDWATGEKSPRRNWGPGGTQTSAPGPGLPLTTVPPGVQREEGTASLKVIQDGVARTEGGHDVGRLGAGEGH